MGFVDAARERIETLTRVNGATGAVASPPPAVRVRHVTVRRGDLTVLEDIDFAVTAGQMVAVIGDSAQTPSIRLHAACGFEMVGTLKNIGFKFGRWLDSVLMQRALGAGAAPP